MVRDTYVLKLTDHDFAWKVLHGNFADGEQRPRLEDAPWNQR